MLLGRVAAPLPDPALFGAVVRSWPRDGRSVLLRAPEGGIPLRQLAREVETTWGAPAWVRVGPYDMDAPAIDSLLWTAMAMARSDAVGTQVPTRPPACVIEGVDRLSLAVIGEIAERTMRSRSQLIMVANQNSPHIKIFDRFHIPEIGDMSVADAQNLIEGSGVIPCSPGDLHALTEGHSGTARALVSSMRILGAAVVGTILRSSTSRSEIMTRLGSTAMRAVPEDEADALRLACLLGYGHRSFRSLAPALGAPDRPWWVPLVGSWRLVDPLWRTAILLNEREQGAVPFANLSRLVGELVDENAVSEAIELCLDAGWPGMASDLLERHGSAMLEAGNTGMHARWASRISGGAAAGDPEDWVVQPRRDSAEIVRKPSSAGAAANARRRWRPFRGHGGPAVVAAGVRPADKLAYSAPGSSRPDEGPGFAFWPSAGPPSALAVTGSQHGSAGLSSLSGASGSHLPPIAVRLFGTMELLIDENRVERWRGNRGRMLLAYLVLYRSHPLTSEMLSVLFWPDASPKSARNRLHVVMNGLRKDLAAITDVPIVIFRRGYLLNPDLAISVDTERFERIVDESLRLEAAGNRLGAIAGLRQAAALYRGPLLNDTPYEEWAWGLREHYHVAALRALDHLAGLLFEVGSYDECLEVCERVLIADLCREDIHRLAMRCYSRLNQPHLATRQFQNYRRQLSHEFGLLPDKATLELAEKIRRREPI